MAKLYAQYSIDINFPDLNWYQDYWWDSYFYNDSYGSLYGSTYEDLYIINGFDAYNNFDFGLAITGRNIGVNYYSDIIDGTITGIGEYFWDDDDIWFIQGISLPAVEVYQASLTTSNADDVRLLASALSGNDQFYLSDYDDVMSGFEGNDMLDGGGGNDKLIGGSGRDVLDGGNANDRLIGGGGNDRLEGGAGNDKLSGGSGRDVLDGGNGNDRLIGGGGNDRLEGGAGNDKIKGGGGTDTFIFDKGSDKLVGGGGRDTVEFDGAFEDYGVIFGKKVIVTFEDNRDVLIGMERLEFDDVTYARQSGEWVEVG